MDKNLKIGIIGCGFMGRMHGTVYSLLERAELVACVDINRETAKKYSADFSVNSYTSLEEMLTHEEIDAIDICVPTYLHKDFTIKSAQAGKDIVCEKPMALILEDAQEMISACAQNNVRLMIAHCIRFWPEYAYLKELVDSKKYGKLLYLNLTRYGEFPHWSSNNWLAEEAKSGGAALDMHIHDTDYALFVMGEPDEIHSYGIRDEKGMSYICSDYKYNGAILHLEGGWNFPPKTPFKMTFRANFEDAAAIMEGSALTVYPKNGEPFSPEFAQMKAEGGGNISDLGGYYHELKYFVDCVLDEEAFTVTTPESSMLSLRYALKEIQSASE